MEINEQGAIFHDAKELWGRDTYATEDFVKTWIKDNCPAARDCAALTIGPGGENGAAFSVIENHYWRSAGRAGPGAVMGSKHLKAIGFWGARKRPIADQGKLPIRGHKIF